MRALLIANPQATAVTPALIDVVAHALASELKLDVARTRHRDDASGLAADAVSDGCETVIALGGDGTVNEVVQALARTPVRLAVVPAGSTNVFARALGLPNDPIEAAAAVLAHVSSGAERAVGLGSANGRWFTFAAGLGFDAHVVRLVERSALFKRMGPRGVVAVGLGASLAWRGGRAGITLALGSEPAVADLRTIIWCNAGPYSFLGRRAALLCPDTTLEGGLEAVALTRISPARLARIARAALSPGGARHVPGLLRWRAEDRCIVTSSRPMPLQLDGEYVGQTDRLLVRSVRDALQVVAV